jgi:hypothetical protein
MRKFLTTCALAASAAVVVLANHPATFVLRNGNRVNGGLSYKGGTAYTLAGQDYEAQNVALVAFVEGDPTAEELRQISSVDNNPNELERHAFVMRDGRVILGKLYKFSPDGETVTFDARDGGRRDVSANDLARIYINPGAARSVYNNILQAGTQPVATTGVVNAPQGSIAVNGNQPWTDTAVDVRAGDQLRFTSTGEIRVASGNAREAVANPNGSGSFAAPRNGYPVPAMAVGGLIARVGNSKPFPIGMSNQPIRMPADGRLYLGINDDGFGDNSGAFYVTIARADGSSLAPTNGGTRPPTDGNTRPRTDGNTRPRTGR